jgi:phosphopantothenoylcysteine decarboxylase/phosphopantothenate--cysteine ligase
VLNGKNILLGVTGSIAAYKSVEIVRRLREEGAVVTVVMTEAAHHFVPSLTFEVISGRPVYTELFEGTLRHIELVKESNLFIIAPATANTINKLASGIADNLLSTLWLSFKGPMVIAPAMNHRMYENPVIQESINKLKKRGVTFVGPERGSLACGEEGIGRMSEVSDIIESIKFALTPKDLSGQNVLVTAGPTREHIDPVRFLSNRSSGKMGYAIAMAAYRRGANVTLISGPTSLKPPMGISFISVERAVDMERAVLENFKDATIIIMAAAVCDFAPARADEFKLPKTEEMTIKLKATPDILQRLGRQKGRRFLVGFAAETGDNIIKKAQKKLRDKSLDLIVVNDVTKGGAGFDVDTNIVSIITKTGEVEDLPLMKKEEVANVILDWILKLKDKDQKQK